MAEWLAHPAATALLAGVLALCGAEVGRRIAKRAQIGEDADETLAAIRRYMLPHFEPRPGSELLTLPARVANLEAVCEANRAATVQLTADLGAHVAEEEAHHVEEAAERADRQRETDSRIVEVGKQLGEIRRTLEARA